MSSPLKDASEGVMLQGGQDRGRGAAGPHGLLRLLSLLPLVQQARNMVCPPCPAGLLPFELKISLSLTLWAPGLGSLRNLNSLTSNVRPIALMYGILLHKVLHFM